jgi:hypothetical protein
MASKAYITFFGGELGRWVRKAQIEAVVEVRLMAKKLISIIKFNCRTPAFLERQLWATVITIFKNGG